MSAPRLTAIDGPLNGRVFSLDHQETFIGRGTENQIILPEPSASRRHCSIEQKPDATFLIRDLDSHNGTFVNGLPITGQGIEDGDEIRICHSRFIFQVAAGGTDESELRLEDMVADERTIMHLRRDESVYLRPDRALESPSDPARMVRGFRALLGVSAAIHAAQETRALAHQILTSTLDAIPAERAAVLLTRDEAENAPTVFGWERATGPAGDVAVSRAVLDRVRREGVALLSNRLAEPDARSVVAAPLSAQGRRLGVLYLESSDPRVGFDEDHLQLATAIGLIAGGALAAAFEFERLRAENRQLKADANEDHQMIGESAAARELFRVIARLARADTTVLITGETGTGKELVARALHCGSSRASAPFVAVNCAALTEHLLESELFGHEKGAFTGAVAQKKGKFEIADSGTLFLDEIGELAPSLQAKLLRVLQEREFERVGGTRTLKANVRIIAATNRDLTERIKSGTFRDDLFYRLHVVNVRVPPLRERKEDIALLASHFLEHLQRHCPTGVRAISSEAFRCLEQYDWPGNIRELENAVERAFVLASTDTILPEDLPEQILDSADSASAALPPGGFQDSLKEQKRQLISAALEASGGNYTEAARKLGLHPNSLHRLIRNLGMRQG